MVFHGCFPVSEGVEGDFEDSGILEFVTDSKSLFSEVSTDARALGFTTSHTSFL